MRFKPSDARSDNSNYARRPSHVAPSSGLYSFDFGGIYLRGLCGFSLDGDLFAYGPFLGLGHFGGVSGGSGPCRHI